MHRIPRSFWQVLIFVIGFLFSGCGPQPKVDTGPSGSDPYKIRYDYNVDGEIWFRNAQIQLRFDRDLYCRVFLRQGNKLFSINDIPANEEIARPPSFLVVKEAEIRNFLADYRDIGAADFGNQFGPGKRMHLAGYAATAGGIVLLKTLKIDFFEKYPNTVLLTTTFQNRDDKRPLEISRVFSSFYRMDAARANSQLERFAFSHFIGTQVPGQPTLPQTLTANYAWSGSFNIPPDGSAIPFLDLWCDLMGMAIGEMLPAGREMRLSLKVAPDKRVEMGFEDATPRILKPGEILTLPRNFLMVHTGDYQVALEQYRQFQALLKDGKKTGP